MTDSLRVPGHLFVDVTSNCEWAFWIAECTIKQTHMTIYWCPVTLGDLYGSWYAVTNDNISNHFWAPNETTANWVTKKVLENVVAIPKRIPKEQVSLLERIWEDQWGNCQVRPGFPNSYEDIVKCALVRMPIVHERGRGLWASEMCAKLIGNWREQSLCDFSKFTGFAEEVDMRNKAQRIMEVDL